MSSILYPLCAILAWLAAFYKLPSLRRQKDASLLALCAAFMLLAATFTISTPTIWLHIDRLAGYPNISALLSQGCVIIFTAALQVLLLLWLNSRDDAWAKIRPRSLAFAVVLAVMAALFLLAPAAPENPTDFAVSNAEEPYYAAYLLLYAAAFAVMQIEVIRLCVRYARSCGRPWFRRGLRTATAGAAFGLIYCLARTADVAAALSGLDPRSWEPIARIGAGGGEILYLIGWTMPSWGPRLSAAWTWMASYRAHRQLYPLWAALYGLNPQIALDPPGSGIGDILNVRDLHFRLHRRVIEIQDGRLALRPYLAAAVTDAAAVAGAPQATAAPPGRVDPAIAAAQLRTAIGAKVNDMPPATVEDLVPAPGGQPDFDGEMKWLVAVTRAFSRSAPAPAATAIYRYAHGRNGVSRKGET
jgi:hypothetical protein